jgi:tight adherence protein B
MTVNNLILIVVALAVLLAAEAIYYLAVYMGQRRRAELHRRLQTIAKPREDRLSLVKERRVARSPFLDRLLRPLPAAKRMEKLLLQTDLTWTVATVLALSILLGVGLTLLLLVVLHKTPALALIGVPVGMLVPLIVVLNARTKRSQKFSTQLPDALEMIVRSLRAGHGLSNGFKLVAGEMPPPVAVEFGRCFEEQQFGVEFRDAIEHMTQRVPNNIDLRIFAVSVVIQQETGGNLVEILEKIANTIRERYKFFGKLRALTAEGKYSGYILGALPFVCLGFVALLNPGYLVPLVANPLGRLIGLGGLTLWGLGVLWMSRMVKVDY